MGCAMSTESGISNQRRVEGSQYHERLRCLLGDILMETKSIHRETKWVCYVDRLQAPREVRARRRFGIYCCLTLWIIWVGSMVDAVYRGWNASIICDFSSARTLSFLHLVHAYIVCEMHCIAGRYKQAASYRSAGWKSSRTSAVTVDSRLSTVLTLRPPAVSLSSPAIKERSFSGIDDQDRAFGGSCK